MKEGICEKDRTKVVLANKLSGGMQIERIYPFTSHGDKT